MYYIMSLNQFTDLSLKDWMQINAKAISVNGIALPSSATGISTSQPVSLSLNVNEGVQSLQINKQAYFASYGGGMATIGNGGGAITLTGYNTSSLNFGTYDGSTLIVTQPGYYYVDYNMNATFPSGASVINFQINLAKPGSGTLLFNQLANPTSGTLAANYTFAVANSAIIKLAAGDSLALSFSMTATGGTGSLVSVSLVLVLLDPVSA